MFRGRSSQMRAIANPEGLRDREQTMTLTGLHLLLTYQCNLECDHCFVWGSPWQTGTMTLRGIRDILGQAKDLGTIDWIYFEGGEPFLYYSLLLRGARLTRRMGFRVGIVSNGFWATEVDDAVECLRPFRGIVDDLSVSSDLFHWTAAQGRLAENAREAARRIGIPVGVIRIAQPEERAPPSEGQLPAGESAVMFRGRAAEKLVAKTGRRSWTTFTSCPHENLEDPGRVHVDPLGNVHVCQGVSIGNLFRTPLKELVMAYRPQVHPILGPLVAGGPAELVRRHGLEHQRGYVDACHLCYEARRALRARFGEILTPDQMYGVVEE